MISKIQKVQPNQFKGELMLQIKKKCNQKIILADI
jgi:hypothetical protein